jgi:putative glutamine amidotransferase
MNRKRIGITQRVEDVAGRDERRDCLDQAWTPLLCEAGLWPVPLPNTIADPGRLVADLGIEGLVLTGGNDLAGLAHAENTAPERDRLEGALLDCACRNGLPVLGVCRGMQFIVRHFGGTLRPVEGHVATRHPIEDRGSPFPVPGGPVNSFHQWGAESGDLGGGLEPAAMALDGTVEAAFHEEHAIWCVMWHPERPPADGSATALLQALFGGDVP